MKVSKKYKEGTLNIIEPCIFPVPPFVDIIDRLPIMKFDGNE